MPRKEATTLAIISDLHFCDATAVEKNISPAAFELALSDIQRMADDLRKRRGSDVHIDLVFLGDVFDLLRTERWFEAPVASGRLEAVPLAERPWASPDALDGEAPSAATIQRARAILADIRTKNTEALSTLRNAGSNVRKILVLGNHDRLALHDPSGLHRQMREALGAVDETKLAADGFSTHGLVLPHYGLLARHGHEWDLWNFERFRSNARPADYKPEDYLAAPIGDPITTELAVRLPWEIKLRLAGSPILSDDEKAHVYQRMQRIEDVRPLVAALQWAFYEAEVVGGELGGDKHAAVHVALEDSVKNIVASFKQLDFYRAWHDRHHKLLHADSAELLRAVLEVLSVVTFGTLGVVIPRLEKIIDRATSEEGRDRYRLGAALEDLDHVAKRGLRYVVYGHTHDAVHSALHATVAARDTYLNTGTFRRRVFRTDDRKGFMRAEHMTYLCFFTAEEAKAGWNGEGPAYTAWTGTRSPD